MAVTQENSKGHGRAFSSRDMSRDRQFLRKIRRGDRAAMAAFVLSREPLIRARIRAVMGGTPRPMHEPDDIISLLLLRLDGLVTKRNIRATGVSQLAALVLITLDSVLRDSIRQIARDRARDPLDPTGFERAPDEVFPEIDGHPVDPEAVWQAGRTLDRFDDRVLFFLIVRGVRIRDAATVIGREPGYARVRWGRIRARVRRELLEICSA